MADRDVEAFGLLSKRLFAGAALAELRLEMTTSRLTIAVYGALRGGSETHLGTMIFFGTDALKIANGDEQFPFSARLERVELAYADDEGKAAFVGAGDWQISFEFDGVSYFEHPAVLASLSDDR